MKEFLIGIHLVGLSMSFVRALTIDLSIAKQLLHGVSDPSHVYKRGRNLSTLRVGFGLLLASGLGLILLYWVQSPALLANPKIWAKGVIVLIAALNGYVIEHFLLSHSNEKAKSAAHAFIAKPTPLITVSLLSISWASWIGAFALGVWKSINFIASFKLLMTAYIVLIAILALGLGVLRKRHQKNLLIGRSRATMATTPQTIS